MDDEVVRMWKKSGHYHYLPGGTEENYEKKLNQVSRSQGRQLNQKPDNTKQNC